MSRWLIAGGHGMLGRELTDLLRSRGDEVVAPSSAECDVRCADSVSSMLSGVDVVVNAAAWTAVDAAEEQEAAAFAVNAVGAHNVALAAARTGTRLVHVSTDYVFDGKAIAPYPPGEPQGPSSAYGRTKAAGEWAVRAADPSAAVLRAAWLYGEHGGNFVATMLRLAATRETLTVVDDQLGQPTWTRDLAEDIVRLGDDPAQAGYRHSRSFGATTWFDFAQEIFAQAGLDPARVTRTSSQALGFAAPRPAYSVLSEPVDGDADGWRGRLRAALPRIRAATADTGS